MNGGTPERQEPERLVRYGTRSITYLLFRSDRKTVEIAVHPDSTVVVKAPLQTDDHAIAQTLIRRARWIVRQQNHFRQFMPRTPPRSYVQGETHLYLGRQYRLRIAEGALNTVTLSRGFFQVTCKGKPDPETTKKLLQQWYATKARIQFAESMERCWQKFPARDLQRPRLSIRRLKTRWGSLSDRGTLTLNTELIRAPKECMDYVVTHELCHLRHRNHSPAFYNLLGTVLPDWKKIKHRLETGLS